MDIVKVAGLTSNSEFESQKVKDHIKKLATSAVNVDGLSQMVSGAVVHQTVADRLDVDLGVSVNEISEVTGPTDVYFKDVTTADGRTNPDGMGTLLVVASGAENLRWPGGTRVYGSPPANSESFASLVRVSGTVHVIWSAADSTSTQESNVGPAATKAYLNDVLSGNIRLEPGASVIPASVPPTSRVEWMFTNILSDPLITRYTLVNGSVAYRHVKDDSDFYVDIDYGPNAATKVSAFLPTNGEPPKPGSGWVIALSRPTRLYDYIEQIRWALGGMPHGSGKDPNYPFEIIIPYHEGTMNDDGSGFYFTFETPGTFLDATLSTDIPLQRSNEEFEAYGVKIHFEYLSPEDIDRRGGWR